ncbi:hypothetical protein L3X38_032110 [Prunus dulcis]|uniref:RNase H type-1 domain-containing protein n=1 Tax=Prunus dulcis TaxID=3755 RepID=A0AAD4VEI0_PRUDU|nr:hypothetical protein L3X38_032110 [Prunus dulcis]
MPMGMRWIALASSFKINGRIVRRNQLSICSFSVLGSSRYGLDTPFNYRIDKHGISTLHQWLRDCVTVGLNTKEERNRVLDHIALMCWTIWKTRNRAVFLSRTKGAKSVSFHAKTALVAEAVALLEGSKFARERNLTKVCFESDSLELNKRVKGNIGRGRWNFYPVLTLISEEQWGFEECSWNWTNRIGNQATDNLVSLALSRRSTEVWVERTPTSLVHILSKEGLPYPHLS